MLVNLQVLQPGVFRIYIKKHFRGAVHRALENVDRLTYFVLLAACLQNDGMYIERVSQSSLGIRTVCLPAKTLGALDGCVRQRGGPCYISCHQNTGLVRKDFQEWPLVCGVRIRIACQKWHTHSGKGVPPSNGYGCQHGERTHAVHLPRAEDDHIMPVRQLVSPRGVEVEGNHVVLPADLLRPRSCLGTFHIVRCPRARRVVPTTLVTSE